MLSENHKIVKLLASGADKFSGTVTSPYVSMRDHNMLSIFVEHNGGTTGKSTLTLLAATSAAGAGAAAVAFFYRRKTTGASDVWGAITAATSAGIDTVPAEDTIIELMVKSASLPDGSHFVALNAVEAVNDPVNGSAHAVLSEARYKGVTQPIVLA